MYWTNIAEGKVSIEKARMDGTRENIKQVYVQDTKYVELGALVVDPSGEFLYFVEKRKKKFIKLSLQGICYGYPFRVLSGGAAIFCGRH